MFSIALGYYFGLFGVLIATSIARVLTNFWYEPYVLFDNILFKGHIGKYFFNLFSQMVVISVCSFASFYIVNYRIHFNNRFLDFAISCVFVVAFSAIAVVLSALLSKNLKESLNKVIHMVKR